MVKVLLPHKPEVAIAGPGMRVSVMPSPHVLFLDDYEYCNALGRDPLQQNSIWSISDPTEQVAKLKEVLQEYQKQKHRRQLLFKAASRGDEAIVRFLVGTGLKVHPDIQEGQNEEREGEKSEDEEGIPDKDDPWVVPIHVAATRGKLGCLKFLLENIDVDIRDDLGRIPLIAAAQGGDTDTIKYLLGQGADPTARSDSNSELPKEYMGEHAGADALEIVAAQRKIEADEKTSNRRRAGRLGDTARNQVVAGGEFETLKLLLEREAYPMEEKDGKTKGELLNESEKQTIIDDTPTAAERGDLESLKLLLSYQYATEKDGRLLPFEVPEIFHKQFIYDAYHAMIHNKPGKFDFIKSFGMKEHDSMSLNELPEGQLINIQHLLEEAVANGSIDCVKLMIEKYGANPHQHRVFSGIRPLFVAAFHNKPDRVRYLLEDHKVDIQLGSGRFATGPTALWIAIHLKIARLCGDPSPARGERNSVRLETEENAQEHIDNLRKDFQNINPPYVRLEIGADDREWIRNLQPRRPDEQLREEGEGAKELNENEKVKNRDLDDTDPRRTLAEYPTNTAREEELNHDDDVLPEWKPDFVPARQDDDD
ncbi:hypothetical protein MMC15_003664 [Xylographa vitiligo]|nr:hypothetical protein [Xylographa vitiligo]